MATVDSIEVADNGEIYIEGETDCGDYNVWFFATIEPDKAESIAREVLHKRCPQSTHDPSHMTSSDIHALRERLGLSQQGLANRLKEVLPSLKADRNIVSRWERGVHAPNAHAEAALRIVETDASAPLP